MFVAMRNNLRRARSKGLGRVVGAGPMVDSGGIGNGEFQLVLPLSNDDGVSSVRLFVTVFMSRDEMASLVELLNEARRARGFLR